MKIILAAVLLVGSTAVQAHPADYDSLRGEDYMRHSQLHREASEYRELRVRAHEPRAAAATAAPEIDAGNLIAGLTLLLGAVAVMKGRGLTQAF